MAAHSSSIGRNLTQPAPWLLVLLVGLTLLMAPAWLGRNLLSPYLLRGDDFEYIARSRTWEKTKLHLFISHNAHVVPLFRLWTYGLNTMAGKLESLPVWCARASYFILLSAMLGLGHFVAWETRRLSWGFAAMTGVGFSSILLPTIGWYSAAQALLAGSIVIVALDLFQYWRWRGGWILFGLGNFLVAAAPWVWSGGYIAGTAAFAYLWLSGHKRAAIAPFLVSLLVFVVSIGLANHAEGTKAEPEKAVESTRTAQVFTGLTHTGQAIPELLIGANLGLDFATTPWQGAVLTLGLIVLWTWSRSGQNGPPNRLRPNGCEGAGAVLILGGFCLAYTYRGNYNFDSLRSIFWYQAIPDLGWFVFLAGWLIGREALPEAPGPPRRFSLRTGLGILCLMIGLLILQTPRVDRTFLAEFPPLRKEERILLGPHHIQLLRGQVLAEDRARRQTHFLARLDAAERLAWEASAGKVNLRPLFPSLRGPGMPRGEGNVDGLDLLNLPRATTTLNAVALFELFRPHLHPEPRTVPKDLPAGMIWPDDDW